MTLTVIHGDIFKSKAQVLVNPVNTVGVMGRGLAARFKQRNYPMFRRYAKLCSAGSLRIGTLHLTRFNATQFVLNFPTKADWHNDSKLEYVEVGLQKFVESYASFNIHSIAFPPLGCGLGGLDFDTEVLPLMTKYLDNRDDLDVTVYVL